ncbi:protein pxr1-like [Limosa lapponica baueri]|uniref:Protein pxr1-like n=1 Tax=Limosa lapponica baueri TaxID=1758121 RepID=A0A2I0UF98_LIMLA|nr:protein pxr1-like [Limosa lapponica baueri]
MSDSYKTVSWLAKPEPITGSGSISVITYLRRGKITVAQVQWRRGVRTCERNSPAGTKISEEGRGRGTSGIVTEIPLQLVVMTMMRQAIPLQTVEFNGGTDIHTTEAGGCAKRGCDPVDSLRWSRLLAGPPWRKKPTLEQICWQEL